MHTMRVIFAYIFFMGTIHRHHRIFLTVKMYLMGIFIAINNIKFNPE